MHRAVLKLAVKSVSGDIMSAEANLSLKTWVLATAAERHHKNYTAVETLKHDILIVTNNDGI